MSLFENKTVVITGGTGSLGKVLARRLLGGTHGRPRKVIIFSRDEAKQHLMRLELQHRRAVTDEAIYQNFERVLEFRIGDIRDYASVCAVLRHADVVVNAAALKQVPACEYFPFEAVETNVRGAENLVRAIREHDWPVAVVVGVSTDKACKPVNVMGMTKALQERVLITANITVATTRFVCVRYGNVLASRGSVIPLFHEQIRDGGPLTVTTAEMTRFLLPLECAVDTIVAAVEHAAAGEIFVPRVPSARILDVAHVLIGDRNIPLTFTGIRPGEKVHELLVSSEEGVRTFVRGDYLAIQPLLPELSRECPGLALGGEYSSHDAPMSLEETRQMLTRHGLLTGAAVPDPMELLR